MKQSEIDKYVAERKADDGRTYTEQVEPHIVDMDVLCEMYVRTECNMFGDIIRCDDPDLFSRKDIIDIICQQIVMSAKALKCKEYLVAFSDIEPYVNDGDPTELQYYSWRAIA